MTRGWWQPIREQRYTLKFRMRLTFEEYKAFEYLRKHMNLGMGAMVRLLLHEWITQRSQENAVFHRISKKTTWEKIQEHMASGKWHGLPDKALKVTKQADLEPRKYAAAAHAYGVHPELAQLLSDYGLELQRLKAVEYVEKNGTKGLTK